MLNADDAWTLRYRPRGRVLRFSLEGVVEGAYLAGQHLMLLGEPLVEVSDVPLRGRHNLANVLAAMAAAHAAAIDRDAMQAAVRAFKGVPHRLQTVAERDGVQFVDDSIATAPERSIAALRAYDEPLVLVAGGRDKHLPMDAWADLIARRVKHVVLLGEMSELVAEALEVSDPSYTAISRAASMDEAVAQAARAARTGDVVLLSPGGTSYDMYTDFEERGRDFARAVGELSDELRRAPPLPLESFEPRRPDYLLLASTIALLVLGALMVYSASFVVAHNEFNDDAYFLVRQLMWIGVGGVGLLVAMRVDYRHWRALSLPIMFGCIGCSSWCWRRVLARPATALSAGSSSAASRSNPARSPN